MEQLPIENLDFNKDGRITVSDVRLLGQLSKDPEVRKSIISTIENDPRFKTMLAIIKPSLEELMLSDSFQVGPENTENTILIQFYARVFLGRGMVINGVYSEDIPRIFSEIKNQQLGPRTQESDDIVRELTAELEKRGISKEDIILLLRDINHSVLLSIVDIDLTLLIKNLKLLENHGIRLSTNYAQIELNEDIISMYKIIGGDAMEYVLKQYEYIKMKGFDLNKYTQVIKNNEGLLIALHRSGIQPDYALNLVYNGFSTNELTQVGSLLNNKTVLTFLSLSNIGRMKLPQILKYLALFQDQFYEDDGNAHIYIERIDALIGGDTHMLSEFLKQKGKQKKLSEILILLNTGTSVDKKLSKLSLYKKEFGGKLDKYKDEDINIWLIGNNIKPENIRIFLNPEYTLNLESIAYLGLDSNWKSIDELTGRQVSVEERGVIVREILRINPRFTGEDIIIMISHGLGFKPGDTEELEKAKILIQSYLKMNPKFTGNDIVDMAIGLHNRRSDSSANYLPTSSDYSQVQKYRDTFGKTLTATSLLNLMDYEKRGGIISEIKEDIKKLSDMKTGYTIDEMIVMTTSPGFGLSGVISNLAYKNIPQSEIKMSNLRGVRISDYKSIIGDANRSKSLISMSLTLYIELRSRGFTDATIIDIGDNYLKDMDTLSQSDRKYQFEKNLLEFSKRGINELTGFIRDNPGITIKVGTQELAIAGNLQFLHGIIQHLNTNIAGSMSEEEKNRLFSDLSGIDWAKVIESYQVTLSEYLEVKENIDTVFFMAGNHYYGEDKGNNQYKNKDVIMGAFKDAEFLDYSTGTVQGNTLERSAQFVDTVEQYLQNKDNAQKNVLIYVGLHGDIDGNGWTSKGNLSKKEFSRLNQLAEKYQNLKINIDSCNNAQKFDGELKGNIISNSGDFYSIASYSQHFTQAQEKVDGYKRADFDRDGVVSAREISLFVNTSYQKSIVYFGSSFRTPKGERKFMSNEFLKVRN